MEYFKANFFGHRDTFTKSTILKFCEIYKFKCRLMQSDTDRREILHRCYPR